MTAKPVPDHVFDASTYIFKYVVYLSFSSRNFDTYSSLLICFLKWPTRSVLIKRILVSQEAILL